MSKEKFSNIYDAQRAISEFIKNDNNCSAHFKFHGFRSGGKNKLDLVTYNPKTKTHFLLNSLDMAADELELYEFMYEHLLELNQKLITSDLFVMYKVTWCYIPDNVRNQVYLYGISIKDILNKFYYEKKECQYKIYDMTLIGKHAYIT